MNRMKKAMRRTADQLRSARWFGPDDLRSFGHRSRMMQMGYAAEDYLGKPIIGILNTWSDLNPCHAHFKDRVQDVKRGIAQGGMRAKLEAAALALRNGVRRVRIAGLDGINDRHAGTLLLPPSATTRDHP